MGNSCRVGGAVDAALVGVKELAIHTIGVWKSETLMVYIGSIIAARSKIMEAVQWAPAESIWFLPC